MSGGEGRFVSTLDAAAVSPGGGMECEFEDSYGLLENEVTLVMSRDELQQLRLAISIAHIHLPTYDIFRDFLGSTD